MICYHITTEDRLPSILLKGLVPNSPANRSAKKAPFIMLSRYPAWGLFNNWKKNKPNILIEINLPDTKHNLDIFKEFEDDPEGVEWNKRILPEYFTRIVKYEVIK
jgi:hypothetical protein